jgi:hypothetical protein
LKLVFIVIIELLQQRVQFVPLRREAQRHHPFVKRRFVGSRDHDGSLVWSGCDIHAMLATTVLASQWLDNNVATQSQYIGWLLTLCHAQQCASHQHSSRTCRCSDTCATHTSSGRYNNKKLAFNTQKRFFHRSENMTVSTQRHVASISKQLALHATDQQPSLIEHIRLMYNTPRVACLNLLIGNGP